MEAFGDALASSSVTVNVWGSGTADANPCRLRKLATIRGFPVANHVPTALACKGTGSENAAVSGLDNKDCPCRRVAASVLNQLSGRPLSHLIFVGRADRMPFADVSYGGNRGLAQARAKWVHSCLRDELLGRAADSAEGERIVEALENRTLLLSAGPLEVPAPCTAGEDCDTVARCKDRSVDVFACLEEPSWLGVKPESVAACEGMDWAGGTVGQKAESETSGDFGKHMDTHEFTPTNDIQAISE